jgi:hypothetical protein
MNMVAFWNIAPRSLFISSPWWWKAVSISETSVYYIYETTYDKVSQDFILENIKCPHSSQKIPDWILVIIWLTSRRKCKSVRRCGRNNKGFRFIRAAPVKLNDSIQTSVITGQLDFGVNRGSECVLSLQTFTLYLAKHTYALYKSFPSASQIGYPDLFRLQTLSSLLKSHLPFGLHSVFNNASTYLLLRWDFKEIL